MEEVTATCTKCNVQMISTGGDYLEDAGIQENTTYWECPMCKVTIETHLRTNH